MKKKLKFAIIGCAGFVAKKHVSTIKKIKGDLLLAMDKHDNVGFLDKFFPKCNFYKNEKVFFGQVKKLKIDFVVICTPNYLHFRHIKNSLKSNSNVICEKPTVLKYSNLKKIRSYENETHKICYTIFQLRYNGILINLKKKIDKQKKTDKKLKVQIRYFTPRGNWYLSSWKSNKKLSGGLIYNIGVHFFDMMTWFFGEIKKNIIYKNNKDLISGKSIFNSAEVNWVLSTQIKSKLNKDLNSERFIKFNFKKINFTKNFNDLHLTTYRNIIKGRGIKISDITNTFKNLELMK